MLAVNMIARGRFDEFQVKKKNGAVSVRHARVIMDALATLLGLPLTAPWPV